MPVSSPLEEICAVIKVCHLWLEATMSDVSPEQAHWRPPGVANPIAAVYAHVILGADSAVNAMLSEGQPIVAATGGEVGLSELIARGDRDWHAWALRVRMDLTLFRDYANRVYESWYRYFRELRDDGIDRTVDLTPWGMGERTLVEFLLMQVQHFSSHIGEISALKGLQGSVGYRPGTASGIG